MEREKKGGSIKRVCAYCGKEFYTHPYNVKMQAAKYCSQECYHKSSRKDVVVKCQNCGREFVRTAKHKEKKFCCVECACEYRRNKPREATQGKTGYRYVWFTDGSGEPEHRYIVEKLIGRKLSPNEHVHHIDGNRANNNIDNLQILTRGEHSRLHREQEKAQNKPLFGRGCG